MYDLKIRTITDNYYVGLDNSTTKHAYMFKDKDINESIFLNKTDALAKLIEIKGEHNGKD